MNNMTKRTMAAALALTIVIGGNPVLTGGIDILKPDVVANAAATVIVAQSVKKLEFYQKFSGGRTPPVLQMTTNTTFSTD